MEKTNKAYETIDKAVSLYVSTFKFTDKYKPIRPHLMITGPSGSGKTFTTNEVCGHYGVNFLKINAAQLTPEIAKGPSLTRLLKPIESLSPNVPCVVFFDEFDKLFVDKNNTDSIEIQNELLTIMEADSTSVLDQFGHYKGIKVNHIMFIFGGSFGGVPMSKPELAKIGLREEFLGRIAYVTNFKKPTLKAIASSVQKNHSLISYMRLLEINKVNKKEIKQESTILSEILQKRLKDNYESGGKYGFRMIDNIVMEYIIGDITETPKEQIESESIEKEIQYD